MFCPRCAQPMTLAESPVGPTNKCLLGDLQPGRSSHDQMSEVSVVGNRRNERRGGSRGGWFCPKCGALVGTVKVVHEGRGGYVEVDGRRYDIEHVEGGRFCIHFPSGHRTRKRASDLEALEALCRSEPEMWSIERRDRVRGPRPRSRSDG